MMAFKPIEGLLYACGREGHLPQHDLSTGGGPRQLLKAWEGSLINQSVKSCPVARGKDAKLGTEKWIRRPRWAEDSKVPANLCPRLYLESLRYRLVQRPYCDARPERRP